MDSVGNTVHKKITLKMSDVSYSPLHNSGSVYL